MPRKTTEMEWDEHLEFSLLYKEIRDGCRDMGLLFAGRFGNSSFEAKQAWKIMDIFKEVASELDEKALRAAPEGKQEEAIQLYYGAPVREWFSDSLLRGKKHSS